MIDITMAYPLRKDEWLEAFDALKKLELFPDEYLRSKLQKFEDLYSKLLSPEATLEDVLSIIDFQIKLLGRIQQVRKDLNQPDSDDGVEKFIDSELRSQYDFGEINFKDEILFWQSKLGFLLKLETEANRETAMINTYEKALSYIGDAERSLEFYDDAVHYLWSLLDEPEKVFDEQKKTIKEKPRDHSKLMVNIRRITERAMGVSSFKGNSQVLQWKILNEFRYLRILEAKKHALGTNFNFLGGLVKEIDLTECIIRTCYSDFSFAFLKDAVPMFHLFDLLLEFRDIPLAEELFEKIEGALGTVKPSTFQIQEWLINKCHCVDEESIRKFVDLINHALSTIPTSQMLEFCIRKAQSVLHHIVGSSGFTTLPDIILLCVELYSNKSFETFQSVSLHASRVLLFEKILNFVMIQKLTADQKVIESLQAFLHKYPLQEIAMNSLKKLPNCFDLVKEAVLLILSTGESLTEADAQRVLQYLSAVNWKDEKDQDKIQIPQFLKTVVQSFAVANFKVQEKLVQLFKMSMIPGMNELMINHMKLLYHIDMNEGRKFFNEVRVCTSSWKLAGAVIGIETDYCSAIGEYSEVLKTAIDDSIRLSELSSTIEPLKLALRSHCRMKNKKGATELIDSAKSSLISQPNISATIYGEFLKYTDELVAEMSSLGLD